LIKKAVSIILLIFTTLVLPGCGEKELTKYQAEFIMLFDTVTRIVGYTETKEEFTGYSQIIRDDLKEYQKQFSCLPPFESSRSLCRHGWK
jgi:thiamine biosynthesis lipoprotein